jgi:hypothetical protein
LPREVEIQSDPIAGTTVRFKLPVRSLDEVSAVTAPEREIEDG